MNVQPIVPNGDSSKTANDSHTFGAPVIPDHELIRRIGSGSYGKVWLARSATGQCRAVKVVYRASFESSRPFDREFAGIQKYEPISRTHTGLVQVLHVGINHDAGYFYYIMELADDCQRGREIEPGKYEPNTLLSDLQQQKRLPVGECLEIGLSLASALDYLHQKNLVHRDVKLSNIIFVNGQPKLADIGLVADTGQQTFVGTEGYIPPEGPGSASADLYSLGKVLYEISTGKDRLDFPELPDDVSEDMLKLQPVILKACEPAVKNRYRSAQEMHGDLTSLQRCQPVGPQRWLSRRPVLSWKTTLAVLISCVAVIVIVYLRQGTRWPSRQATPKVPAPSAMQATYLASLPAAEVLALAYSGQPPVPPPSFERPRLRLEILAKRTGEGAFSPLGDGETLASTQDDYLIVGQALSAGYLYLFQVDSTGKKEWLFPKNPASLVSSGANPIRAGDRIQIPAAGSQRALFLDTTTGIEHIYAVFSAAAWPELEQALSRSNPDGATVVQQPNGLRLRGVGGTRIDDQAPAGNTVLQSSGSFLVVERWFRHVTPP